MLPETLFRDSNEANLTAITHNWARHYLLQTFTKDLITTYGFTFRMDQWIGYYYWLRPTRLFSSCESVFPIVVDSAPQPVREFSCPHSYICVVTLHAPSLRHFTPLGRTSFGRTGADIYTFCPALILAYQYSG